MTIYKVSYVVIGMDHPGGIANLDHKPYVGEQVRLSDLTLEILEVLEIMPARGGFHYYHVTCQPLPTEISSDGSHQPSS
ncbi:MAG: hypothetical protein A2Z45_10440 [Chloroflexi bacterium RBG_19FT_COMBO_55_16]|nr:MAG: hypothetical protein A2Z45_10440 [Chloroflexi bacterium RBG_19FT_COMBO_55_16]